MASVCLQSVAAMVRGWLAKQDLTHFFELLRGNGDVDQARLHYWLRFANQMGFTRIIMGSDARQDRGSDFVKFREENKGRLSYLRGGRNFDNAMIIANQRLSVCRVFRDRKCDVCLSNRSRAI
nr:EH signature domain-containing protein [Shigella sonnei]